MEPKLQSKMQKAKTDEQKLKPRKKKNNKQNQMKHNGKRGQRNVDRHRLKYIGMLPVCMFNELGSFSFFELLSNHETEG